MNPWTLVQTQEDIEQSVVENPRFGEQRYNAGFARNYRDFIESNAVAKPPATTVEEVEAKWEQRVPMTTAEIALGVGCDPEIINTIYQRALEKIKAAVEVRRLSGKSSIVQPQPPNAGVAKRVRGMMHRAAAQPRIPRGKGGYKMTQAAIVATIRARAKEGGPANSYSALAKEFGKAKSTIGTIVRGQSWKAIA